MKSEEYQTQSGPSVEENSPPATRSAAQPVPYMKPKLTVHGDLRSLTLFGSFDSKDSGLGSQLLDP